MIPGDGPIACTSDGTLQAYWLFVSAAAIPDPVTTGAMDVEGTTDAGNILAELLYGCLHKLVHHTEPPSFAERDHNLYRATQRLLATVWLGLVACPDGVPPVLLLETAEHIATTRSRDLSTSQEPASGQVEALIMPEGQGYRE